MFERKAGSGRFKKKRGMQAENQIPKNTRRQKQTYNTEAKQAWEQAGDTEARLARNADELPRTKGTPLIDTDRN